MNVYRLLRAGLSSSERERLLAGDFRPVIVLLVILVGLPLQGADLLDTLTNKPGHESFLELVDSFPPGELAGAVRRLADATEIPADTAAYARWASRVARYSFRTGWLFGARRPL